MAKDVETPAPIPRKGKEKPVQKIAGHRVSIIGGRGTLRVAKLMLKKGEHYDLATLGTPIGELRKNVNVVIEPVDKDGKVISDKKILEDEALGIAGVE